MSDTPALPEPAAADPVAGAVVAPGEAIAPTPPTDAADLPAAAAPQAPAAALADPAPEAAPAAAAPLVAAPPVVAPSAEPPRTEPPSQAEAPSPASTPADLSPAACAARLAELFPALFAAGRALPLKLRIQADIQQRAPGLFTRRALSPFLHRYTNSTAYLKALVKLPHRVDLDGNPAGPIDDEHRQAAAAELERRRGVIEARRAAEREAQREAQREARRAAAAAEAAARAQHAAEDQARRDRAALLRAFESSTLTRANFCVLKGLKEADLDPLLHQAWLEREQRALEQRAFPRPAEAAPMAPRPEHLPRDARGGPRPDARGERPPRHGAPPEHGPRDPGRPEGERGPRRRGRGGAGRRGGPGGPGGPATPDGAGGDAPAR